MNWRENAAAELFEYTKIKKQKQRKLFLAGKGSTVIRWLQLCLLELT